MSNGTKLGMSDGISDGMAEGISEGTADGTKLVTSIEILDGMSLGIVGRWVLEMALGVTMNFSALLVS